MLVSELSPFAPRRGWRSAPSPSVGPGTTLKPITRPLIRALVGAGALLALVLMGSSTARAASPADAASDTVRAFYGALLDTMQNAAALGVHGRYQKLEPVVQRTFDLPLMTRLSIGVAWDRLTSDQQEHAVSAFGRYVTATYASRFGGYSGEQFPVLGESRIPHGVLVRTQIIKSNGEGVSIDYVTQENDAAWQIRDVYFGGTISELATQRSEFAAILRVAGVEGLIAMLNRKADELES